MTIGQGNVQQLMTDAAVDASVNMTAQDARSAGGDRDQDSAGRTADARQDGRHES